MCFCINKWMRSSQQPLPSTGVPVPTLPCGSPSPPALQPPLRQGSGPPASPTPRGVRAKSRSAPETGPHQGALPPPGQRVRAPASEVTAAPRSGRLNLPPARAPRAGREKRCGGGATGLAPARRGPALARTPRGTGDTRARTCAFLPPGFTWRRRHATGRARATAPPAGDPHRALAVVAGRAAVLQDPSPTTRATYLGAGQLLGFLRSPAGPRTAPEHALCGLGPP